MMTPPEKEWFILSKVFAFIVLSVYANLTANRQNKHKI